MFLDAASWVLSGRLLLEGLQYAAEVAAVDGHGWVVGAEGRLAVRQRPLKLHPGALQVPKGLQHAPEVAAPDGHGRVVGASRPTR
jgi:hypothetical protein